MNNTVVSLQVKQDLIQQFVPFHKQFPLFILQGDAVNNYYWEKLYMQFADYQFALLNEQATMIGCGHTIPLYWDGAHKHLPEGYDEALKQGFQTKLPNTLCALAAVTSPKRKGEGLSYDIIRAMKDIAQKKDFSSVLVPVRPTWKQYYPATDIHQYARWKREDGAPFDPWLRVHWRLGGRQLTEAPKSMHIEGTLEEWTKWTGMDFPESGQYVVPGALALVEINKDSNLGIYEDPNVWVKHDI